MGNLNLPITFQPDVELEKNLYASTTPGLWDAMGDFKESFRNSIGAGTAIRAARMYVAGKIDKDQYLDPQLLNDEYGIEGHLDFFKTGPRTRHQAQYMRERKMEEIQAADLGERRSTMGATLAFGQDLITGMLDPIGMGIGAVVAPSKVLPYVSGLRAMYLGTGAFESVQVPLTRRLMAGYVTNAVDALAGNAILEPFNLLEHQQVAADYGMAQSLYSVTVGGLAGGLIPIGIEGLGLAGSYLFNKAVKGLHVVQDSVPDFLRKTTAPTHEKAFDLAVRQFLEGKDIDVSLIQQADPKQQAMLHVYQQVQKVLKAQADEAIEKEAALAANKSKAETQINEIDMLVKDLEKETKDLEAQGLTPGVMARKVEFDQKLSDLLNNPAVNVHFTADGLILNGKHIKYPVSHLKIGHNELTDHGLKTLNPPTGKKFLPDDINTWEKGNPFTEGWTATKVKTPSGQTKPVAYGMVLVEDDGRIWVVRPKGGYAGYSTTFPKGHPNKGEHPYFSAQREVLEESGLLSRGVGFIGGFERSGTMSYYMEGRRVVGSPQAFGRETEGVQLMRPEDLRKQLVAENNTADLAILDAYLAKKDSIEIIDSVLNHANLVDLPPEIVRALFGREFNPYLETHPDRIQVEDLDLDNLNPIDQRVKTGFHGGGIYSDADGKHYFVKFPLDGEGDFNVGAIRSELAASYLYRLAHLQVGMSNIPVYHPVYKLGNLIGLASEWMDGLRPITPAEIAARLTDPRTSLAEVESIRELGGSFIFDAWLSNRDVYGTGPVPNILTDGQGSYYKIDFGGALEYKGLGIKKSDWGPNVSDIDSFPQYAGKPLIELLTDADKAFGADLVLRMTPETIKSALQAAGFEGKELDSLFATLLSRRNDIADRFPEVAKAVYANVHEALLLTDASAAKTHLKIEAEKTVGLYSSEEKLAIKDYQQSSDINAQLQLGKKVKEWYIEALDSAAKKFSLDQNYVLWRWEPQNYSGFSEQTAQDFQGKAYWYKSFQSMALNPNNNFGGSGKLLWKIDVPKGTHGFWAIAHDPKGANMKGELEFVGARDHLVFIDSVVKKTGFFDIGKLTYWEVNARLLPKEEIFQAAGTKSMAEIFQAAKELSKEMKVQEVKAFMLAQKGLAESNLPTAELSEQIDSLVRDIWTAQKPDIPILTEKVDLKTPLMKELDKEIADMEAALRANGLIDESGNLDALKEVNEGLKKADEYSQAIYQAWSCYKSH